MSKFKLTGEIPRARTKEEDDFNRACLECVDDDYSCAEYREGYEDMRDYD